MSFTMDDGLDDVLYTAALKARVNDNGTLRDGTGAGLSAFGRLVVWLVLRRPRTEEP